MAHQRWGWGGEVYLHFNPAIMYCCPNYGNWKILLPKTILMPTVPQLSFSADLRVFSKTQPLLSHIIPTFLCQGSNLLATFQKSESKPPLFLLLQPYFLQIPTWKDYLQWDWLHPIQIPAVLLCKGRQAPHFKGRTASVLGSLELVYISQLYSFLFDVAFPSRLYKFQDQGVSFLLFLLYIRVNGSLIHAVCYSINI